MRYVRVLGFVALWVGLVGAAFAAFEPSEAGTVGSTDTEPAAAAKIPGGTAKEAASKPQPPAEKHGDWAIACPSPEDGSEKAKPSRSTCRMVQSAVLSVEGKDGAEPHIQRVMVTTISFVPDQEQPVLSLIVPLGIHLPPGIRLQVDGYDELTLPLQRCDAIGCIAVLPMKELLVEAFRKGKEGQVTFFNVAGKGSKVRISLDGFRKGLEALSAKGKR